MKMLEAIHQFSEWRSIRFNPVTVQNYKYSLLQFCIYLRNPEIEDVSINDVMDYLQILMEYGYDNNGIMPRCIAMRKFFHFYRLQGYPVLHEELVPIPQRGHKLPRVANEAAYKKIMAAIPRSKTDLKAVRDRALISMLWDTGARNGEILSLNVKDVDTEKKMAVIKTEKAKTVRPIRQIFWTDKTNKYLEDWLKLRTRALEGAENFDKDAIFVSLQKGFYYKRAKRMRPPTVCYVFNSYCKKAKIEPINPHSFRHYMAHNIIKQGGSNADVANILGHSTLTSSLIYTMMANKELEDRYRQFKG